MTNYQLQSKRSISSRKCLKRFEDVSINPDEHAIINNAKSESSLFAQQEKALATMYVEDDPDNLVNVLYVST